MNKSRINEETLQDVINIGTGLFAPLTGFMNREDYRSVIEDYTLTDGQVFTLPITLDVEPGTYEALGKGERLELEWRTAAAVLVEDKFMVQEEDIQKVFLTLDDAHPGVKKEKGRSPYRVGGKLLFVDRSLTETALQPAKTRQIFKEKGWKTVAGFQTRNPVHKAHEHLQRIGLEICDGLFINPLTGWKKKGDFTQEAVMAAYRRMERDFYPANRVHIEELKTQMRYAGPREAIFHAIIRRNLGCTHFLIGRDHAGVGGYYGAYDAHRLAEKIMEKSSLHIELLMMHEPYYCKRCGQIVTDKTCAHYETDRVEISGTIIRTYIGQGSIPDETMMRKEIFEAILGCGRIFIE